MLDADEERLLLLEEEFRELMLKEADILLRCLLCSSAAKQRRVRRLVAETKNRHAPIFTLPVELLVSIVQETQQATDHKLYWGVESDEDRFATYLARSRTYILSVTAKYDAFYGKEECECSTFNEPHLKIDNVDPVATSGNPWISGLTRLDFRETLGGMSPRLLANCPQLIDLTLDDSTFSIVDQFMPMPVSMLFLRSLRVLCLNYRPTALTSGALSIIHTPALEFLQFSGAHINQSQISSFFNRLSPSKRPKIPDFCQLGCRQRVPELRAESPGAYSASDSQKLPALESLTIIKICHANALLGDL
ncbi:hypothetical protein DFH08DRAFT_1082670 [Mycena albidolilacea]|uniref:Uncharacterized protein n=1 Tax=Mycena albidolilacea TaxID=1033008 RepID=A0AAD7ENC6_9AGAR|nr:hypothetical protein DFH08DRAFT_1082670 [Mycena albidolilacea]